MSVSLVANGKIEFASNADVANILGVVSCKPSIVGDAAWSHWTGKYVVDKYGERVTQHVEKWEFDTSDGKTVRFLPDQVPPEYDLATKRVVYDVGFVVNPTFDPTIEYVPREGRKEWSPVGLVGKLRLLQGQPVNPNWKFLRIIADDMDEYMVL